MRATERSVSFGAHPQLVCIGASTGGTEAVKQVLQHLPTTIPPVLIVQHMPVMFTGAFAKRLDSLCVITVKEAEQGERLHPGVAYIAPGDAHLAVRRTSGGFECLLSKGPPVSRHRPSVDVLFRSVAAQVGAAAIGVLLTGMGKDGADGLLELRRKGAWTIAQDQQSCVVYGMPREAAAIGAAAEIVSLAGIGAHIVRRLGLALAGE
jgi:two-component system chemotaxis response regulator CheB